MGPPLDPPAPMNDGTMPPDGPPHCRCFANGQENESVCEGMQFGIDQCMDLGDKCHWGPGESEQCKMEEEMYRSTTPAGDFTNPAVDELFYENENPETGEHFDESGNPNGEMDPNFDANAEEYPVENYDTEG